MDFQLTEQNFLYPIRSADIHVEDGPIKDVLENTLIGNYTEALKNEKVQEIFKGFIPYNEESSLRINLQKYLQTNLESFEESPKVLFCVGIASLQLFVQNNFTGPLTGPTMSDIIPSILSETMTFDVLHTETLKELSLGTEGVYNLLSNPEYLFLSHLIFDLLQESNLFLSADWWSLRCSLVHQKVVDENSPLIYESGLKAINKMEFREEFFEGSIKRELLSLFYFEVCQFYLHYHDIPQTRIYFKKAKEILGLELYLTGALGRRTRWQQDDIAQLVVKVEFSNQVITQDELPGPHLLPSDLPEDILLSDDTRLNKINYTQPDEDMVPNLKAIEQILILLNLQLIRKSCAQDAQLDEETKAFLWAVLQHPKNWALQMSALLLRSQVEVKETRAMERSMTQLEELVTAIQREEPSRFERLKLIYASSFHPLWTVEQELARILMRLGCIKTALDVFERLHLWEDLITCYNELQMRQRSAEIIQQLLEKEETPKLWCLLGDATDEIEHYNKAWELSNLKSARAQRCLGNYYYVRKDYNKAIEYYEKSVELNTLQFPVWLRLGYCALQAEEYEKCANAYRKCSILEPDSFECWNNMSQAYIKLGQMHRAWKSLQEALRCNQTNWRLWDNYMLVSTSLGYMQQALFAYNKILSLKERHVDTEIIGRIVAAVLSKKTDPDGKQMDSLYKKCTTLLAQLTREVPTNPELWFLYGDMISASLENVRESKHTAMQHYRKSVATATQKTGWEQNQKVVYEVLMRSLRLVEISQEVLKEASPKLALSESASLRMLLKSTLGAVKRGQTDIATDDVSELLKEPLSKVEESLNNLNNFINSLKAQT